MARTQLRSYTCGWCGGEATYEKVDRLSMGYYCSNHADKTKHPQGFHGYLNPIHVGSVIVTVETCPPSSTPSLTYADAPSI